MGFQIIYEDDTELADYEALNKGYRKDVIVVIGEKKYKLYVTSMVRLQQDFELEQENYGYYMPEPNTVFVKDVTKTEIEAVIAKLYQEKYFGRLDEFGFWYERLSVEEMKRFEELLEAAKAALSANEAAQNVIVVKTAQGAVYCYLKQDVLAEETSEEGLKQLLESKQDIAVTELLCMSDIGQITVPSNRLRELLIGMTLKNIDTKVLLKEKDFYHVKTLGFLW